MKRFLCIVVLGAVFGAMTAAISAQIFNSIEVNSERPHNHWYDSFIVLLTPGSALDDLVYGKEGGFTGLTGDSIQGDDLKDAVIFNALAWPFLFLALACLFSLIRLALRWISFSGFFSHVR